MSNGSQGRCFTIMPFTVRDTDLSRYYDDKDHWNEVYRGLIVPAVKRAGLVCERDDEDPSSRLITENIWRKIEAADVVLCDLSAYNPNVYLELGWTLRADKRFILIKDDVTQFNFDLNQFYTYQYSHRLQPSSLERSVIDLADIIRVTLADQTRKYSMVNKLSIQQQAQKAVAEGNLEVNLLQELLSEVRLNRLPQKFAASTSSPSRPRVVIPPIRSQADLSKMLIGSTWRKRNDVEQVIFQDETTFYNNLAGHPSWRKNQYTLGAQIGTILLEWSIDGLEVFCRFNDEFNQFTELEVSNPLECVWTIVATEPYTPSWGV